MNLDHFHRQNEALGRRIVALLKSDGEAAHPRDRLQEVSAALAIALEQLRAAEMGLRHRDESLLASRADAEAQLQRYYDLFQSAPVGYLVTGAGGAIFEANLAATALLSAGPGALEGRSIVDLLDEPDRAECRLRLDRLARQGGTLEWEARLPRGESPPISVGLTVAASSDWDVAPACLHWIVREVPSPGSADFRDGVPAVVGANGAAGLRAASAGQDAGEAAGLRALLDGIDAIIWEAGPDGRFRFINRRAEDLLGHPAERWLSDPDFWLGIVHPDDRAWAEQQRRDCLARGRDGEMEYRVIAADGRVVWLREALRLEVDGEGRVATIRGALWAIGKRKKVERQLYAARRELAEERDDLAYLHDLSRRLWAEPEPEPLLREILTATAAIQGAEIGMIRLYDPARRELEIVASVGLPDEFLARYGRVSSGETPCGLAVERGLPVVFEDLEADPEAAPFREAGRIGGFRGEYSTPLISRAGEVLGTIATCFREPHRPPERQAHLVELFARQAADFVENARLHRELREADRRKEDALATLAHELRTPISVVLNAAQAMAQGDGGGTPPGDLVELITRQSGRMARLVEDLLVVSCLARGEVELRMQEVDLGALLADAAAATRPMIEGRGHELMVALPPEPLRVEGDPGRLEQVLANLLTNAARYTEPGGQIRLEARCEGDCAAIRVCDTGIGIAPEKLANIFDPYVQADHVPGSVDGGLGLGLALVKGLIERHGGTVSASSDGPGRGSEFVVRLPIARPGGAPRPAERARRPARTTPARRVLVVDDQPDAARSLARLLHTWGHEPRTALDGPSALAEAAGSRPEVVLLDVAMPGMDGNEVARRLRSEYGREIRIVALTGFGRDDGRGNGHGAEFDDYLIKPVAPDDLRDLIERPA